MQKLVNVLRKKERLVIGVMSGTSLDGVDIALMKLSGTYLNLNMELVAFKTYPIPEQLKDRIQQAFNTSTYEICKINFDLGYFFAQLILTFCKDTGIDIEEVDLIGSHGQTIYHIHNHSTLQVGEADIIANLTQTVVISDFRTADIAAGGTGAPLVPYFDRILFKDINENIALQNLGGIGNVTFLSKQKSAPIIAFDTGPANAILNELTEIITDKAHTYDKDAFLSKEGFCNEYLLRKLLTDEYFDRPLPKSTGREEFGKHYVDQLLKEHADIDPKDILRTCVSLVANSVHKSYQRYIPKVDRIYLCGGGAHHPIVFQELEILFGKGKVQKFEMQENIDADSKEAAAFAVLAHEKLNNTPTNIPNVTGAMELASLGKISVP